MRPWWRPRGTPCRQRDEDVTWLEAADLPLPEWPPDPVAFGPPLVADPTNWRGGKQP